jgi:hypothetical protein
VREIYLLLAHFALFITKLLLLLFALLLHHGAPCTRLERIQTVSAVRSRLTVLCRPESYAWLASLSLSGKTNVQESRVTSLLGFDVEAR